MAAALYGGCSPSAHCDRYCDIYTHDYNNDERMTTMTALMLVKRRRTGGEEDEDGEEVDDDEDEGDTGVDEVHDDDA